MKKPRWMIVILTVALMCILPNAATQAQSEAKPQDLAKSSLLVRTIDKRNASGEINKTWNAEYRLVKRGDDSSSSSKTATAKMHQISSDKSDYGALFTDLQPGDYDVYQIVAPEGRLLVNNPTFVKMEGSGALKVLDFASPSATVRGKVRRNGHLIAGEPVQLVNLDNLKVYAQGITDAKGKYDFKNVAPGRYQFSSITSDVSSPNDKTVYRTSRRQISVNKTTDNMDDEVRRQTYILFKDDALTLKVLDETTNQPLENVKVLLEAWGTDDDYLNNKSDHGEIQNQLSGLTSSDGTVTFKNLYFKKVRISIEGADASKTDSDTHVTLESGIVINKPQEVTLKATKKPKNADTHRVRVNILDEDRKVIVESTELGLVSKMSPEKIFQKQTSSNGVVTFENVPKGEYVIKQLAVPVGAGYYRDEGQDLTVSLSDVTLDTVEFPMLVSSKSVALEAVAITRNEFGGGAGVETPVEYAVEYTSLSGLKQTNNYKSNEEGFYKLDKLKPGSYRVRVTKSDGAFIPNSAEHSFAIDNSMTHTKRPLSIVLSQTRVEVTTKNEMQEALANAKYTVWKGGKQVEKGVEIVQIGNKTMIDFLSPGTYQLRQETAVDGHHPLAAPQEFIVSNGMKQLTEVTVVNRKKESVKPVDPIDRLDKKYTLQVNVTDEAGVKILEPTELVLVSEIDPETIIQKGTSKNGIVSFTDVPKGTYIVKQFAVPVDEGYYLDESKNLHITLTDDVSDNLVFRISISSKSKLLEFLQGQLGTDGLVYGSEELPADFVVKYTSQSGVETTTNYQLNSQDFYKLDKLKPGSYQVRAIRSDAGFIPMTGRKTFEVDDTMDKIDPQPISIYLSPTRVEITTKNNLNEVLSNVKYTVWQDDSKVKGAEIVQIGNKMVVDFLAPGTYQLHQEVVDEGHHPMTTPQEFVVLDGVKQLTEVTVINRKREENKSIKPGIETTESTSTAGGSNAVDTKTEENQTTDSLPKTGVRGFQSIMGALMTCLGLICLVMKKKKGLKIKWVQKNK